MLVFEFKDHDSALEFWRRVVEQKAETLKERNQILLEMTKEGHMKRVQSTDRTKKQLVEDWGREYSVVDLTTKDDENEFR